MGASKDPVLVEVMVLGGEVENEGRHKAVMVTWMTAAMRVTFSVGMMVAKTLVTPFVVSGMSNLHMYPQLHQSA